ncbi:MAG: nuclear transport factor 2 family protein [Bacteroidaceae bacterium]|nr:nuclear transport factor 2 family protein [Bacteroidaceae bacterium]
MRSNIEDYNAVVEAASKFTKSVAEGNSKYAKELFTEDACLFGFLNGNFERGSIDFTDVLLLLKIDGQWKCVAKAYNQNSNTISK